MRPQMIEFDDYIAPDGTIYPLNTDTDRFAVSETGDGLPPYDLISQRGPMQHGETVVDYRLRPRTLQFIYRETSDNRQEYWDSRSNLLDKLAPNRQLTDSEFKPGQLRKRRQGVVRCIDVYLVQGPAFEAKDPTDNDWLGYTEALRFYAPNPWYYDPAKKSTTWTLAPVNGLIFPITFPIIFGNSIINDVANIDYTTGTWQAFPDITVTGPIYGPTVLNETTNEKLQLNYDVQPGEIVYITLPYGNKEIVNNSGKDLQAALSDDSRLAFFHLSPRRVNVIRASGTGVTNATSITLSYYTCFIGI